MKGELILSGDKSLSHRAVILAGIRRGRSSIKNFLYAEDTINTLNSMKQLGVQTQGDVSKQEFTIISEGVDSFRSPQRELNLGNSGTGARLLLGLIAGCKNVAATIDGDESLRKRPMKRITAPLKKFGAKFKQEQSQEDHLPITVEGTPLKPIEFEEEIGSAQVKSACILAAISSQVSLNLIEKKTSRDHTENMLRFMGISIESTFKDGFQNICLHPPYKFKASNFKIWGDVSSAAFFIALACLTKGSKLITRDVLLSKHRIGYIHILKRMGANIDFFKKPVQCGEEGGDVVTQYAPLKNISINKNDIPSVIDEIPILAIVAAFSQGVFEIRGAQELRYKESDRIHSICSNLRLLGYECEEYPDGFRLRGDPDHVPRGLVHGFLDHRIIMAFEVANQVACSRFPDKKGFVSFHESDKNKKWIKTSFPTFYEKLNNVICS